LDDNRLSIDREGDVAFILKCTRRCNLRCRYCTDRAPDSRADYDIELVATLLDGVAGDTAIRSVSFIWHGGEPLLLGVPFFRKVHYLQGLFFAHLKHVQNVLQTNASLLTPDWAAHFQAYGFQLGVSLDGPAALHDRQRPGSAGKSSFDSSMAGIEALRAAGVQFGILTVATDEIMELGAAPLMDFFERQSLSRYALLSLRKDWQDAAAALDYNRRYGEFLCAVAREWLARDNENLRIREVESKFDLFFGLPHRVCKDAGHCVGKYFCLEADGGLWHCDKFFHDPRFRLGNIREEPLAAIRSSTRAAELRAYEDEVRSACKVCKWFHLCGGGCLYDSMCLQAIGGRPGTGDCNSYLLFEEISGALASNPELLRAALDEQVSPAPWL
jgi:uncharacterized protein